MQAIIAKRTMCQQAIYNLTESVNQEEHLEHNVRALQRHIRYLHANFESFRMQHVKIISRLRRQEQLNEQAAIFDRVERCYITTTNVLEARIDYLKEERANFRANEREDDNKTDSASERARSPEAENRQVNSPPQRILEQEQNLLENAAQQPQPAIQQTVFQQQVPIQQPLPQIVVQIPSLGKVENTWGEFDGRLSKWKGFHDRFKVAVHDNGSIAKVFKFQYLCNSLKGWAASAFGNWEQTDDNYDQAWERLNELYNRPYETTNELYDRFEALPKLDKPSGGLLQKISNTTHEVIRQLRALSYPVEHFDSFFVNGIRKRLDGETCKQWELYRNSLACAQKPLLSELLAFVDNQAKAMFAANSALSKDNRKRSSNDKEQSTDKKPRFSEGNKKSEPGNEHQFKPCPQCKGKHALYSCDDFKSKKLYERKRFVKDNKVCPNCLNSTHDVKECKRNQCYRCETKHNSLLCPENPRNKEFLTNFSAKFEKKNQVKKSKKKAEESKDE